MTKHPILFILTLFIVCSCNQEFKHNPTKPYPELGIGEYWIDIFDQRGLQNAIVFDNKLYVNTINISKGDNFIYCLNLENGKVLWRHKVKAYASQPVAVNENMIYFSTYLGNIYAFTLDGTFLWTTKLKSTYGGHTINQINNNLIVRSVSNGIYEFDASSGQLVNHYEKRKGNTLPSFVGDKMTYSTHEFKGIANNLLKCLDYKTRQVNWEISMDTQITKVISTKDKIIAHDRFSGIYCFDLMTGKTKWSKKFDSREGNSGISLYMINDELVWYRAYDEQGFLDIVSGEKVAFKFDELKQKYDVKMQDKSYQIEVNELLNSKNKTEIKIKKATGNNV